MCGSFWLVEILSDVHGFGSPHRDEPKNISNEGMKTVRRANRHSVQTTQTGPPTERPARMRPCTHVQACHDLVCPLHPRFVVQISVSLVVFIRQQVKLENDSQITPQPTCLLPVVYGMG